jgi:hypothetical protein
MKIIFDVPLPAGSYPATIVGVKDIKDAHPRLELRINIEGKTIYDTIFANDVAKVSGLLKAINREDMLTSGDVDANYIHGNVMVELIQKPDTKTPEVIRNRVVQYSKWELTDDTPF